MRASQPTNTYTDRSGRPLRRMSLEQRSALRKRYNATVPGWRHPIIGYLACIPLVVLTMYVTVLMQHMLTRLYIPSSLPILAILFAALFWGVGPALFALVLSTLALDYYVTPPVGTISIVTVEGSLQLLPFVVSGLTIAVIVAQRERARLNSLAAEQELQSYAQELEEINRKLEDTNQMKDRFLSIASHELKTPITTIRGQTQLVQRRLAKQRDLPSEMTGICTMLERVNEQTGRLTSLVDELLDVSSIRAGKVELRRRMCDLKELCRQVVDDQHFLTGRSIVLDLPPRPIKMLVDGDRLSQVLVNLISNAIKYSPEKSEVVVSINQDERAVVIKVQDHGQGIAKNQIPHVFDTFYRTPEAESSSKRGLGLGLAISKDIVERHNGRIWCESEQNKGSTFIVELPITER